MFSEVPAILICIPLTLSLVTTDYFAVENICATIYDDILEKTTTRSILVCSNVCLRTVVCKSFIYNEMTNRCVTSSTYLNQASIGCGDNIRYGYSLSSLETSIGSSCTEDEACTEPKTECRDGMCQCLPTYVFNYFSELCVFIKDCVAYGTTFQTIAKRRYTGDALEKLTSVSANECATYCITNTTYTCRLFYYEYNKFNRYFYDLEADSDADIADKYHNKKGRVLYQRDCAKPFKLITE